MNKWIDVKGVVHETPLAATDTLATQSGLTFFLRATSAGELYNPHDCLQHLNQVDRYRGGLKYTFRTCSEGCFKAYLAYLRTKNTTHLIVAQRRFHDDAR